MSPSEINGGASALSLQIVMFASHKGGTGRTAALVSCAVELATNGARVLVLDLDFDAPGVSYFPWFRIGSEAVSTTRRRGAVGWFCRTTADLAERPDTPLSARFCSDFRALRGTRHPYLDESPALKDYVHDLARPEVTRARGSLCLIHPGGSSPSYRRALTALGISSPELSSDAIELGRRLRGALHELSGSFDYVLVDCRPGLGGTSYLVARTLADSCVLFTTTHTQSMAGILALNASFSDSERFGMARRQALAFSPVPRRDDADNARIAKRTGWLLRQESLQVVNKRLDPGSRRGEDQAIILPWNFDLSLREWHVGLVDHTAGSQLSTYYTALRDLATRIRRWSNPSASDAQEDLAERRSKQVADLPQALLYAREGISAGDPDLLQVAIDHLLGLREYEEAAALLESARPTFAEAPPSSRETFHALELRVHLRRTARFDAEQLLDEAKRSGRAVVNALAQLPRRRRRDPDLLADAAEGAVLSADLSQPIELLNDLARSELRRPTTSMEHVEGKVRDMLGAQPGRAEMLLGLKSEAGLSIGRGLGHALATGRLRPRDFNRASNVALFPPLFMAPRLARRTRKGALADECEATGYYAWVQDLRLEDVTRGDAEGYLDSIVKALARSSFVDGMTYLLPHSAIHATRFVRELLAALTARHPPEIVAAARQRIDVRRVSVSVMADRLAADAYLYFFDRGPVDGPPRAYRRPGRSSMTVVARPWDLPTLRDDADWVVDIDPPIEGKLGADHPFTVHRFRAMFEDVLRQARPVPVAD